MYGFDTLTKMLQWGQDCGAQFADPVTGIPFLPRCPVGWKPISNTPEDHNLVSRTCGTGNSAEEPEEDGGDDDGGADWYGSGNGGGGGGAGGDIDSNTMQKYGAQSGNRSGARLLSNRLLKLTSRHRRRCRDDNYTNTLCCVAPDDYFGSCENCSSMNGLLLQEMYKWGNKCLAQFDPYYDTYCTFEKGNEECAKGNGQTYYVPPDQQHNEVWERKGISWDRCINGACVCGDPAFLPDVDPAYARYNQETINGYMSYYGPCNPKWWDPKQEFDTQHVYPTGSALYSVLCCNGQCYDQYSSGATGRGTRRRRGEWRPETCNATPAPLPIRPTVHFLITLPI